VKYPCDVCEFAAAAKKTLKRHIKIKHKSSIEKTLW